MNNHKLQYEATLNFRCTKPLHPSMYHAHKDVHFNRPTIVQENL